ncbi:SCO family protein [Bergeyella cardium]|uniref:SCO family protein n=1 Tax=Bergeyella cardium TaxID=1585976 RepID=UPI000EA38F74|nr:SCO family protein [Bergeyella cardium]
MRFLFIFILVLGLSSCKQTKPETLPQSSVYNLSSEWENQNADKIHLADLKGKVVVMVMIYTSCKTACPQLTAEMEKIARETDDIPQEDIRYVLVSIDPEHDTPEVMKDYLKRNKFQNEKWLFLRSSIEETRELANVLAVKYKQISPIDFSHSNIISVFDKNGVLAFQKEGLSLDVEGTVKEVRKQTKK